MKVDLNKVVPKKRSWWRDLLIKIAKKILEILVEEIKDGPSDARS